LRSLFTRLALPSFPLFPGTNQDAATQFPFTFEHLFVFPVGSFHEVSPNSRCFSSPSRKSPQLRLVCLPTFFFFPLLFCSPYPQNLCPTRIMNPSISPASVQGLSPITFFFFFPSASLLDGWPIEDNAPFHFFLDVSLQRVNAMWVRQQSGTFFFFFFLYYAHPRENVTGCLVFLFPRYPHTPPFPIQPVFSVFFIAFSQFLPLIAYSTIPTV